MIKNKTLSRKNNRRRSLTVLAVNLVVSLAILTGCTLPMGMGVSVVANSPAQDTNFGGEPTASPTYYNPPADATATPTPFQPVPPTPIIYPTSTPTLVPTPLPTDTPMPTETPQPVVIEPGNNGQRQMNILLLGSDKRPHSNGFRTDTIILATLNMDLGTVNLTSFPRDLYVEIPGFGTNRINTAWGSGGFDKLADTMQHNFGVRPEHYVLVHFSSFKQIIDSLGGLDVHVKNPVSDYRAGRWVNIPKGTMYMDADMVLWYARSRKTTSDFYRNQRQQEVLQAVFEKMLTMNGLQRIPEFYDLYKNNVKTDMTWEDILAWLPLAAKMTDGSHVNHYFVGPDAAYDWVTYEGAMVLIPRADKIKKIMRKALNQQ